MSPPKYVRIAFPIDAEDAEYLGVCVEYLWAEMVGKNCYRLDGIPLYAWNVSADDVVLAYAHADASIEQQIDDVPVLLFSRVRRRSGNATAHVMAIRGRDPSLPLRQDPSCRAMLALCDALARTDCLVEAVDRPPTYLLSINIPPTADRAEIEDLLDTGNLYEWIYNIQDHKRS